MMGRHEAEAPIHCSPSAPLVSHVLIAGRFVVPVPPKSVIKMTEIFKRREEMEEFLHNLGVEYRYSCYRERNADGEFGSDA
jgi:hypothetical protein